MVGNQESEGKRVDVLILPDNNNIYIVQVINATRSQVVFFSVYLTSKLPPLFIHLPSTFTFLPLLYLCAFILVHHFCIVIYLRLASTLVLSLFYWCFWHWLSRQVRFDIPYAFVLCYISLRVPLVL